MFLFLYLFEIVNDENLDSIIANKVMLTDQINHLLALMSDNPELAKAVLFSLNEKIDEYNQKSPAPSLCSLYSKIKIVIDIDIDSKYDDTINEYTKGKHSSFLADCTEVENVYDKYNKSYFNYLSHKTIEDCNLYKYLLMDDIELAPKFGIYESDLNIINNFIKPEKEVQTQKNDFKTNNSTAKITDDFVNM